MKRSANTMVLLVLSVLLVVLSLSSAALARSGAPAPEGRAEAAGLRSETGRSMIAVIESNGLNVLHQDFKLAPGDDLVLPAGIPKPEWVSLPRTGTFEERAAKVRSGPLGHLRPGKLYWIRGTRIGIFVPPGSSTSDILAEPFHGTGTVSSAVGRRHGTNPDGLAVFIPDHSREGWSWLADQEWIDIVSTSYVTAAGAGTAGVTTCPEQRYIQALAEDGHMVFSSSGNFEHLGAALTPSGSPHTYQVGGVDSQGKTYLPAVSGSSESVTPTRPYETGDRFDYLAADPDSRKGSSSFGGTSGAAPSTAGRAATLVEFARGLVGSTAATGVTDGALVKARKGSPTPATGPLEDGKLTRDELTALLHHVAIPAEPASPGRYLVEGYGALNDEAVELAMRVLEGSAEEPVRADEDAMHGVVEQMRMTLFPPPRCD